MKQATLRPSRVALATALTAALSSTAAFAQSNVTIYGAIGLDVLSANNVYDGTALKGSVLKIEDNAIVNSRIGFKGSEDLGGGLKAEFALESSISPDTGAARSTFWNRNAFLGLKGGMGSLRVGHQWNVSDDYMCGYFVCGFYSPFLMPGFYAISDFYDNAIKYTTPNVGGLEGAVMYTTGEQPGRASAGQKFQAAVNYGSGPLGVAAVVFSEKDPNGVATNTLYELGASYDFGAAKGRLGLASAEVNYFYNGSTKLTTTVGAFDATVIDVGVDLPLSAQTTASLDYVRNDKHGSGDDTSYVRARGSYALSKRTSLNANVIYLENSGNANFVFVTSGQGFSGKAGQSQTMLTLGITHAF